MAISVADFGAKGDGKGIDQKAIQKAIDACGKAGGGTVVVPAGTYRTGTLKLCSGIELHLEAGAVIRGTDTERSYPVVGEVPLGNSSENIRALLWAENAEDISVTGLGAVDGGGTNIGERAFGPALVHFRDCSRVRFTDVRLHRSCSRALHLLRCHDVNARGVSILTDRERTDAGGIAADGCTDVRISDCTLLTGGDSICLKSTGADCCENVLVANCVVGSGSAALKLGTESVGDIRNVVFSGCAVRDSSIGIALYMKDGGVYENVTFSNCMVEADGEFPVVIDISPRYHSDPKEGTIRNVTLDTIYIKGRGRIYLEGRPESPISACALRNITFDVTGECAPADEHKPAGSRRVELDPEHGNYAAKPFHLLGIRLADAVLENLTLEDRRAERTTDRGVLYLKEVHGMTMSYRSSLAMPSKKPEMLKEGCQNVRLISYRGR
jgi:polygalacturonase